ncbi:MAG: hypothetical protein SAL07_13900 [Oscillatoria sp. PMC 1051.18]|uniref:hypothetical protein n=1 Tax=Oscillatoria salina TaxID=331517 RepID=UPI001CCB2CD8|nr:hypothetical protein [Oscillatoria salina]MBZ8180613.1 hypothetical protein [Oscillatoria salina IIICB1]MEC4894271.1 hypothetical protein [Oscillatoria sp. PMC 1050.18]MEC5030985.1 hypothetical protein [Oscillatoria sp. PMC 1051.18]
MNENFSSQSTNKQATSAVDPVCQETTISVKLNCRSQSVSIFTYPKINFFIPSLSDSENYESDVELAIDVFKSRNPKLIKALKDFFLISPSPTYIEQIFTTAIYRFAESDSDTCRWLLHHPDYLMPELDLVELASKLVIFNLKNSVLIPERDFSFKANGQLYLNERAKAELLRKSCSTDWLIIKEILQLG